MFVIFLIGRSRSWRRRRREEAVLAKMKTTPKEKTLSVSLSLFFIHCSLKHYPYSKNIF